MDGFFCYTESFWFAVVSFILFLFFFLPLLLVSNSKKKKLMSRTNVKVLTAYAFFKYILWFQALQTMFSSLLYSFRLCILVFNSILHFCVWHKIVIYFHSLSCDCLVFPIPFIEEIIISPLYILCSFVVN